MRPAPVPEETLDVLKQKLEHIAACVHVWEMSGVARPRAIRRTVNEIEKLFCLQVIGGGHG